MTIITAAEMAEHYKPLGDLYLAYKRIEKLEADNARLRETVGDRMEFYLNRIEALEAENALLVEERNRLVKFVNIMCDEFNLEYEGIVRQ